MNKRKIKRVTIGSVRGMDLLLNRRHYKNIHIKDISSTGLFTEGKYRGKLGDEGELLMKTTDTHNETYLKLSCRISRLENSGLGLEFIFPKQGCFLYLETVFSYFAKDPLVT